MFESDDWDLDQDFLNDVDDKAVKFYSQSDNEEIEPKRRKIEICNDSVFSPDNNVDLHDKKAVGKKITKLDENKESRKNFILGMFNRNVSQTTCDSKRSSDNTLLNPHSDTQNCEGNQLPRKNLVLEILRNKNIQDKVVQNNIKNVDLQKVESKIEHNSNTIIHQGPKLLDTNRVAKNNYQRESAFNNANSKLNSFENSRKELLGNIMKLQSANNAKPKNPLSITKYPQDKVQPNKKMTLVRKFPGPAGLLPDDIDANVPPVSYLNSFEENEEANEESNSSKLPEYCSQNTKNLFTEGAWQLMLDDLPHDFLKGYEIAFIKQMASTKGCSSTKVKFLAGIIERIDHSHENPPIVLRDFTDNIQGIVHRDIPLKYPGLLEPNVVVLLHDVGLLKISSTFVSNKYQILISPSSLLGIYTNKGEIERTRYMASILENVSKEETNQEHKENEDCVFLKPQRANSSKTDFQFKQKHSSNVQESIHSKKCMEDIKSKSVGTNFNETAEDKNESMDFDVDFSFSPGKITNSQNQKNFNVSSFNRHTDETSKQQNSGSFSEKQQECTHNDDKDRAKELLKALKRFSPSANPKKRFSFNSKSLQTDAEHLISTEQVEQKVLSDTFSEQMDIDDCDVNILQVESMVKEVSSSCSKTKNVKSNNTLQRNRPSIRSKLLQFKNTETLSPTSIEPQIVSNSKENDDTFKEKKSPENSFFFNDVRNTENDSDDEILSQLDMDTIFSNYNKEN